MIALTLKHLHHHTLALLIAGVLLGSTVFTGWVLVLAEEMPSLMNAATGVLYYLGPLYILYVHQRLVASDYTDGTAEFLSALPLTTLTRLVVPFAIGAVAIAMVFETLLLSTALLATRREGVPLSWLMTLHVQVGLYALAWHCLAFGAAHFGRYRWLLWWVFFVLVMGMDGTWIERPFRTVLWHGVLADPTEQARSVPPWDAIPITVGWAALGLLTALILATYRGGSLVDRWYSPSTGRQRGSLIVGGVVSLFLSSALEQLAPDTDTWASLDALPAIHAQVKVAGGERLEDVGAEVVALLDRIGTDLGVEQWPPVVLHPSTAGLHRHVRRAIGDQEVALVLLVDPSGPRDTLVRSIVTEVLLRQTGDLGARIDGLDWLVQGTAGWYRPSAALDLRWDLAAALTSGGTEPTRLTIGPDLAEAVAVKRLEGLEAAGGREAVFEALSHGLGSLRGSGLPADLRLRIDFRDGWLERTTGVAAVTLPEPGSPPSSPPVPSVAIDAEGEAWVANLAWAPPQGAVLERMALDSLEHVPPPDALPRVEPAGGRARIPLSLDTHQPAAARVRVYWPPIEGWISSPWSVR